MRSQTVDVFSRKRSWSCIIIIINCQRFVCAVIYCVHSSAANSKCSLWLLLFCTLAVMIECLAHKFTLRQNDRKFYQIVGAQLRKWLQTNTSTHQYEHFVKLLAAASHTFRHTLTVWAHLRTYSCIKVRASTNKWIMLKLTLQYRVHCAVCTAHCSNIYSRMFTISKSYFDFQIFIHFFFLLNLHRISTSNKSQHRKIKQKIAYVHRATIELRAHVIHSYVRRAIHMWMLKMPSKSH